MENKKTARVILIGITIFMLLTWIITAGSFGSNGFENNGHVPFGLVDFFLAPINVFNYYVSTLSKNIEGYVNTVSYFNIIMAFITIGIYYGVLNKTGAYQGLVNKVSTKLKNKRDLTLIFVGVIFYLLSVFTGLNLVLFFMLPFFVAILMKLKFNRQTVFTATIGSMLIGRVGCLFDSNVNGLNRIIVDAKIMELVPVRVVLCIMLLVLIIATLFLTKDRDVKKEEDIPLFDKDVKANDKYVPMIVVGSVITIILMICMYNWYYMFNTTSVTNSYNNIINTKIAGYSFMKNIFGMSESFGYFTGFTMSALLLIGSLVIKFLYSLKFDNCFEGVKNGFSSMIPTVVLSILSLTIISFSLYNSDSFIYTIINFIFEKVTNGTLVVTLSTFIHSFFINDYFATLTTLQSPLISMGNVESNQILVFVTQITNGLTSLVSPFSIYLIAGLSFIKVSYTSWIKYIWKTLVILFLISGAIIFIASTFI